MGNHVKCWVPVGSAVVVSLPIEKSINAGAILPEATPFDIGTWCAWGQPPLTYVVVEIPLLKAKGDNIVAENDEVLKRVEDDAEAPMPKDDNPDDFLNDPDD